MFFQHLPLLKPNRVISTCITVAFMEGREDEFISVLLLYMPIHGNAAQWGMLTLELSSHV